jgi:hypothetical protein
MKKIFLALLIFACSEVGTAHGADSTVSDLAEDTTPTADDLLYVVNDPGGTPASKKATIDNVLNVYNAKSATLTNKTLTAPIMSTVTVSGNTVTLPAAADTLVGKATTDTLTNKTLDAEGTGNIITLPFTVWMPFAACQNATASLIWDSETSNAAAAACVTGTNTQKGVADFDATTDESLQTTWLIPTGFTGSIDAKIKWLAAATAGSVGWCVQLIKVSDAATDDPAFPAQAAGNCVSDAVKGTTLQTNTATITGVTCASCAADDLLHIRVSRDANGGAVTDDMSGDARGIGLELTYRRTM